MEIYNDFQGCDDEVGKLFSFTPASPACKSASTYNNGMHAYK